MPKKESTNSGFFDYLRFGESYTSLLLGIIVVIVSTVLLLSFVHNRNVGTKPTPNQSQTIAKATIPPTTAATDVPSRPKASPTPIVKAESAKVAKVTTSSVEKTIPTGKLSPTVKPTIVPSQAPVKPEAKKGVYVVKRGDTLWKIAEQEYKSGYNWIDIARVNKLNNPNTIHAGNQLVLPKVASKMATGSKVVSPTPTVKPTLTSAPQVKKGNMVDQKVMQPQVQMSKITGSEYTVVKGDNLWNIAVRAYGDGYQWVKIAQANKLANPNIIHSGNKLTIPREK